MYELATNPNCQDKLIEEVLKTLEKHNGQLTYECLQEMIYLENVVLETLRLHPTVLVLGKVCTEPYNLPIIDGQIKPVTIQPGTNVIVPVSALHM